MDQSPAFASNPRNVPIMARLAANLKRPSHRDPENKTDRAAMTLGPRTDPTSSRVIAIPESPTGRPTRSMPWPPSSRRS